MKKQYERTGAGLRLPLENLQGYTFMLLGKDVRVELVHAHTIGYDGEVGIIYLPEENARERLVSWLKANAKRILTDVTERKAQLMGVRIQSITISSAKTRWGSCSYDNKIRYSFRLLYVPQDMIEYVIVHELAHVKHKNHSKAFWKEVEKYEPDYKVKRKWLEIHGALMEIF